VQRLLLAVDRLSTTLGQLFAWLIVALTGLIAWEVLSRKAGVPHAWTFDAQVMLYGILFMMAGAYTLAKNGHVRGDVLYGFFPPRLQAGIDLTLYLLFFLPGTVAMVYAGWIYAGESFAIREHSTVMVDGPPVYPFKAFIPLAGALILLQGLVEIARCVACLRTGAWPSRTQDVVEVDVERLKAEAHVKDEDLAALDELVVEKQAGRREENR
jgi:TRAP-type mannitol/chloroaromatic compound transport system permease small subunit